MPKVPTYLAGVHSHKVRNFLNHFNGACGILKLTPTGRDPLGLTFAVETMDDPAVHMQWVCEQVGMTLAFGGGLVSSGVRTESWTLLGTCESAGHLRGTATAASPSAGCPNWVTMFTFKPTA